MTAANTQELKKSFHQDIVDLYKKIIKIVKYKPTRLMDFINKYGGYEAAVKYISTESNVQDFAVLWECERLDLSVETLITSEKYRDIFNEDVVAHCDRKLKEYSYAPNKIEEVKEDSSYIQEEKEKKIDIEAFIKQKEALMPKIVKRDFKLYKYGVDINKETWKTILLDQKIVTAGNLEFLLRVYAIGDQVGPLELGKEKGFSATYPYKEVMMALGKRIKTALKIEVPVGEDGKPLWWHLLFNGGFKDNTAFEWSLKTELRQAMDELIAEGKVKEVAVVSKKELVPIQEEFPLKADEEGEELSDFDRLFASIMAEPKAKVVEPKTKAVEPKAKVVEPEVNKIEEKVLSSIKKEETPEPVAIEMPKVSQPQEKVESLTEESAEKDEKSIKKACLEYYGAICDLCGFDYGYTYGEAFENMIEIHNVKHTHEVGNEISPDTDPIKDLIPICCNCHQVIHSQNPPISIEKMREMIKA